MHVLISVTQLYTLAIGSEVSPNYYVISHVKRFRRC